MKLARAALFLACLAGCRARAPEPHAAERPAAVQAERATGPLTGVPSPLVLGITPVFDPAEMVARFSPLASHVAARLGTIVELRLTEDYGKTIELAARGELDLVQLSPLAYVAAKERNPSLVPLATNIAEGSSTYSGYIVARPELAIRSIEQLRGLRFGMVHRDSASGYLYPYTFLLDRGFDPEADFKEVLMLGRHDLVLKAVVEGRIEAAATFSGALLNAERSGLDTEAIEIIAKTGRIPYDAWVTRGDLHPSVRARMTEVLLELTTSTRLGRRILGPMRSINSFAPVTDDHYDEMRRLRAVLGARVSARRESATEAPPRSSSAAGRD